MTAKFLGSRVIQGLARWDVTIDTDAHVIEKLSSIGLHPLNPWHRNSSTETHIITMITMATGKPPLTRVESPFDRLSPLRTRTFHTKLGCLA
jgi:hypothetical protein